NLLEGFQVISFEFKYIYVNKTICIQGKKSEKELLGKTMMEVYPGIEKTKMFEILQDCMVNRVPQQFENEFTFDDNSKGWFELRFQPLPEGIGILSINITDRKLAENRIQWLINNDHSTKLPNRNALIETLNNKSNLNNSRNSFSLAVISLENAGELESCYGPFVTDK